MLSIPERIRTAALGIGFAVAAAALFTTASDAQGYIAPECAAGPNQLCKTSETCVGAGSTRKCETDYYYYTMKRMDEGQDSHSAWSEFAVA